MPVAKRQKLNNGKKKKKKTESERRNPEPPIGDPLSDAWEVVLAEDSSDGGWDAAVAEGERLHLLKEREEREDTRAREAAQLMLSLLPPSPSPPSHAQPTRGVKRKAPRREAAKKSLTSDSGPFSSFFPSEKKQGKLNPSSFPSNWVRRSSRMRTSALLTTSSSSSSPFLPTNKHFECDFGGGCRFASDDISEFNAHTNKHKGVDYSVCTHCMKTFARDASLRRHIKLQHEGRLDFPCTRAGCNKKFKRAQQRNVHITYDHDLMAWTCPKCHKECKRKHTCTAHMRKTSCNTAGKPVLKKRTNVK
jgi:hypothetical protein